MKPSIGAHEPDRSGADGGAQQRCCKVINLLAPSLQLLSKQFQSLAWKLLTSRVGQSLACRWCAPSRRRRMRAHEAVRLSRRRDNSSGALSICSSSVRARNSRGGPRKKHIAYVSMGPSASLFFHCLHFFSIFCLPDSHVKQFPTRRKQRAQLFGTHLGEELEARSCFDRLTNDDRPNGRCGVCDLNWQ